MWIVCPTAGYNSDSVSQQRSVQSTHKAMLHQTFRAVIDIPHPSSYVPSPKLAQQTPTTTTRRSCPQGSVRRPLPITFHFIHTHLTPTAVLQATPTRLCWAESPGEEQPVAKESSKVGARQPRRIVEKNFRTHNRMLHYSIQKRRYPQHPYSLSLAEQCLLKEDLSSE